MSLSKLTRSAAPVALAALALLPLLSARPSPARAASAKAAAGAAMWMPTCGSPCTAPLPRAYASMAYDASTRRVVLFGGYGVGNVFLNDTWTWDGATWTKQSPPTAPRAEAYAAMAYDEAAKKVVLFNTLGETWLWDGVAKTWTKQAPAVSPPARWFASMAYDRASGTVVLYSGFASYGFVPLGDTWTWNGVTKAWTKQNPAVSPPPRGRAMMAADPASGAVVLFGGDDGRAFLADTWSWNGGTKTWSKENPPLSPSTRASGAMAASGDGVVLFGGYRDAGVTCCVALGDTWVWGGSLKTWTPGPSAGPEPRAHASMAYDAARRWTVLFGGLGNPRPEPCPFCFQTTWLGDTWLYGDPAADRTPPETTITAGPSGTTTSTTATFEFTSSEPASTFQCALDGGVPASCQSPKTYTGLAAGSHTFSVYATDAAGNADETPAVRTWTVIQPPSAPRNLTATTAKLKGVVLKWTAPATNGGSPVTGYRIYRATTAGAEAFLAAVGNVTSYADKATARGVRYYYQVTAVNAVGESPRSNEAHAVAK